VLLVLASLLVSTPRVSAMYLDPWADEFAWACTQTSGQIITVPVASSLYRRTVRASVYLPPCYDWLPGQLPVIYLLHGANTDETQWPDVGVQTAADALIAGGAPPFVVVMPGGIYAENVDYEGFVLYDLRPGISSRLRVRTDGAGQAIGGISLGGYWALKTAFEHPDQFAAVGGHSPVTTRTAGPDDPWALAATAPGLERLRITLDAGNRDYLRLSAVQLAATLRARRLNVTLSIAPGSHDRPYWRRHSAEYLRFYVNALGAQPPPN
jgi:enterochelin esterase-like enzyme